MERAGRVLAKLRDGTLTDEQLACAAWPLAVGKTIANRTSAVSLVRNRLVVHVEDATWQRQLWTLRGQILRSIEKALGTPLVGELEFRIAVPKRQPARADAALSPSLDEADSIRDPVFRNIYKASRRRANA
jgi:hypothetical protein